MRSGISTAVLAVLLAASIVGSAAAKVLDQGARAGYAYATAGPVHPRSLGFKVTSVPPEPLRVKVLLECWKPGSPGKYRSERHLVATPPIKRHVRLPVRNPSACVYGVAAEEKSPEHRRRIKVTLTGRASRVVR
jgi:hypothetical protein